MDLVPARSTLIARNETAGQSVTFSRWAIFFAVGRAPSIMRRIRATHHTAERFAPTAPLVSTRAEKQPRAGAEADPQPQMSSSDRVQCRSLLRCSDDAAAGAAPQTRPRHATSAAQGKHRSAASWPVAASVCAESASRPAGITQGDGEKKIWAERACFAVAGPGAYKRYVTSASVSSRQTPMKHRLQSHCVPADSVFQVPVRFLCCACPLAGRAKCVSDRMTHCACMAKLCVQARGGGGWADLA